VTATGHDSSNDLKTGELRLDRLLGRTVIAGNGRSAGRLEEFRAEIRGGQCVICEYVIGAAGLFERLGVGAKRLLGLSHTGYVARWDQLDISNPEFPRLTCPLGELRQI